MVQHLIESSNTLTDDHKLVEIEKCGQSFSYFLRTYVKTRNTQERAGIQPFPDWKYLMDLACDFEIYRRLLVHKTRQLLFSWIVAARLIQKCQWNKGEELICVSRGGMYSREIGLRAELIHNNLPEWMKFPIKTNRQFGEYLFPDTESKFMCLAADEDVGRSFSPSGIYFDELAFFPFGSKVMSALSPLLEKDVDFVGGSTANGEDSLFYPMWHDENSDVHRVTLHYSQHPKRGIGSGWAEKAKRRPGMTQQKWLREQELSWSTPAGQPVYEIWNAAQSQPCFDRYSPHRPLLRGFDRGFDDPAIVFTQINDDDQLIVLHSEKGNHVAREKWLKHCKDITESLFPDHKSGHIDYGAADFSKPESDGESWRQSMKIYGIHLKDRQKDDIDRRINAVRQKMQLREDGKFGIVVDPIHCKDLINGLAGGYCYPDKPDFQGHLKPLKNKFSHEADCLAHICDNHFDVVGQAKRQFKRRVFPKREYNPVTGRPLN